jgi:hypothetical protein
VIETQMSAAEETQRSWKVIPVVCPVVILHSFRSAWKRRGETFIS